MIMSQYSDNRITIAAGRYEELLFAYLNCLINQFTSS